MLQPIGHVVNLCLEHILLIFDLVQLSLKLHMLTILAANSVQLLLLEVDDLAHEQLVLLVAEYSSLICAVSTVLLNGFEVVHLTLELLIALFDVFPVNCTRMLHFVTFILVSFVQELDQQIVLTLLSQRQLVTLGQGRLSKFLFEHRVDEVGKGHLTINLVHTVILELILVVEENSGYVAPGVFFFCDDGLVIVLLLVSLRFIIVVSLGHHSDCCSRWLGRPHNSTQHILSRPHLLGRGDEAGGRGLGGSRRCTKLVGCRCSGMTCRRQSIKSIGSFAAQLGA